MSRRTLVALQDLVERGFNTLQADGIVNQAMETIESSDLGTKDFLRAELAVRIAQSETKLIERIAQSDTQLTEKISKSETKLILWMVGLQLTMLGLILLISV